ncbi:MAG: hypothetical protein AB7I04_24710 [Pseudomonadales bacterium]
MSDQDGYAEAVLLFDAEQSTIEREFTPVQFDALVAGDASLEEYAASVVRAAFVVVGAALSVRAAVFFKFSVDEAGNVDPNFNLPLRYLADHAGPGPDLGTGPIRLACRGRCSVPWHSVNLWEPREDAESGSIQIVQKAVWRNRLALRPRGALNRMPADDDLVLEENTSPVRRQQLEERLTETFGEQGRVNLESLIRQNNERMTQVSDKYRNELAQQQQGYLEQIKHCREEIRQLKAALRHEQERSRRLQSLLRGEP